MALKSPPMRNPIAGSLHLQGPSFNLRFCLCPLSQTTEPKKNPCISRPGCCKPVMGGSLFIPSRKEVPSFLCHPGGESSCWGACIDQQGREPDCRASVEPAVDVFLPAPDQCSPQHPGTFSCIPAQLLSEGMPFAPGSSLVIFM